MISFPLLRLHSALCPAQTMFSQRLGLLARQVPAAARLGPFSNLNPRPACQPLLRRLFHTSPPHRMTPTHANFMAPTAPHLMRPTVALLKKKRTGNPRLVPRNKPRKVYGSWGKLSMCLGAVLPREADGAHLRSGLGLCLGTL